MDIFVDTSYGIAVTRPRDSLRNVAIAAYHSLERDAKLITTDEVLVEFLAALSNSGPDLRRGGAALIHQLLVDDEVEVVPQTHMSFMQGLHLYDARPDKSYSLTDCISMALMKDRGLSGVLTADRHFEQEGFVLLMKQT